MGEVVDLKSLETALAFLAGWQSTRAEDEREWSTTLRNDLRTGHCWLLERMADRLRDANRSDEAASALQQLIAIEPKNAMLQYASCKRHLQRELSASPAPDTELLREAVVAHARGRQTPIAGASAPMSLPSSVELDDPLIGRGAECSELLAWFAHDATRLVTVAEPAGTGKTRLAQAIAQTLRPGRRDGALWVSLSELMDANGLEMRVCTALGIAAAAGAHGAALRAHLADKELILVLDRFEHLVEAVGMRIESAADRELAAQLCRRPIQARAGAIPAALDSPGAALRLARRTRKPLWVSWRVESCAQVAIDRGQREAALALIARAELLQREASILPSPRQRASWSVAAARARALTQAGGIDSIETFRAGSMWQLLTAPEAWSRIAVAAPDVLFVETH